MSDFFSGSSTGTDQAKTGLSLLLIFSLFLSGVAIAQDTTVPAATYTSPSTSTAAPGTGPGLSGGMTQREINMMQIRSAAQGAQHDAAAATMAISADRAIEERNRQAALTSARETKRLKREAADRMKWEKAQNAYNRVSADQMSTWKDTAGNVRVERNVPNEFLLQLRAEEAAIAARDAEEGENRRGGPIQATKRMLSWRPFSGRDSESEYEESSGGGFMSNIRPPRLPFVGRGGGDSYEEAPQVSSPTSRPAAAPQNSSIKVTKPGSVPQISGAALVDGRGSVNVGSSSGRSSSPPTEQVRQPTVQAEVPSFSSNTSSQKKGLFSKFKSDRPKRGFGSKKTSVDNGGGIDAGLFPENAVNSTPTGGSLSGNYSANSVPAEDMTVSSTGDIDLPGGTIEKKKRFSIPKPNLSIPKIGGGNSSNEGSRSSKPSSGPSLGTGYYVVASQAQFMQYGESQMESEVRALPAGVVVKLTKPGADWATVQLQSGSSGVIQTKNLRPASSGEVPAQFNTPAPAAGAGY